MFAGIMDRPMVVAVIKNDDKEKNRMNIYKSRIFKEK